MQYIIIERFYPDKIKLLYQRFEENGRMLPDAVTYINSWIDGSVTVCYQLMEATSGDLLDKWISNWSDLADFEIVRVISSAEAKQKALGI